MSQTLMCLLNAMFFFWRTSGKSNLREKQVPVRRSQTHAQGG